MLNILKKYRIPIIVLLVLVLLFTGVYGTYIYQRTSHQNVFDEMIFSCRQPKILSFPNDPSFSAIRALTRPSDTTTMLFYRQPYLNENEKLTVIPGVNNPVIIFFFTYTKEDIDIIIKFSYDKTTKILSGVPLIFDYDGVTSKSGEDYAIYIERMNQLGITADDIEELKHYMLYDKILTDWFEGNEDRSVFSMDNLGEFTVVNDTFADIGTDW